MRDLIPKRPRFFASTIALHILICLSDANANAKAELNRRTRPVSVLARAGIRVAISSLVAADVRL